LSSGIFKNIPTGKLLDMNKRLLSVSEEEYQGYVQALEEEFTKLPYHKDPKFVLQTFPDQFTDCDLAHSNEIDNMGGEKLAQSIRYEENKKAKAQVRLLLQVKFLLTDDYFLQQLQ
jgi:hypothetical protein